MFTYQHIALPNHTHSFNPIDVMNMDTQGFIS